MGEKYQMNTSRIFFCNICLHFSPSYFESCVLHPSLLKTAGGYVLKMVAAAPGRELAKSLGNSIGLIMHYRTPLLEFPLLLFFFFLLVFDGQEEG